MTTEFITLYIGYVLRIFVEKRLPFSPIVFCTPMFKNIIQICRADTISPRNVFQRFHQLSFFYEPFVQIIDYLIQEIVFYIRMCLFWFFKKRFLRVLLN